MAKRKRTPVQDALITVLTDDIDGIPPDILEAVELRLHLTRKKRRRTATDVATQETSSVPSETGALSRSSARSSEPDTLPDTPIGPLGRFLYRLLFALPEIEEFFEPGAEEIVERLVKADKRISILKKFGGAKPLTTREKFERFLTNRSLALSHEQYEGGKESVSTFVKSLDLTDAEEEKLAEKGTYRGKGLRMLEEQVKETGISAVASCESSLFKDVWNDDLKLIATYLEKDVFKPLLHLARKLSPVVQKMQEAFDISIRPKEAQSLYPRAIPCPGSAVGFVNDGYDRPSATIVSGEGELADTNGTSDNTALVQQTLPPSSSFSLLDHSQMLNWDGTPPDCFLDMGSTPLDNAPLDNFLFFGSA